MLMPLAGVNFMEKTISIRNTEVTFSIWDLGGQREFVNMLPLVCNDAVAILFMFDLTRKSTLNSIKEWYRQGRGFNKTAIPFLVGTKYDTFVNFPREEQEEISNQGCGMACQDNHIALGLIELGRPNGSRRP
jgi:GTP-binding protein of the ras superfamily involved in termination of M-phase